MISFNINEQLFDAMRRRLPVLHEGIQYDRILDYVLWYDGNGVLQQSVVLLQNRSSIRVPIDKVVVTKHDMP